MVRMVPNGVALFERDLRDALAGFEKMARLSIKDLEDQRKTVFEPLRDRARQLGLNYFDVVKRIQAERYRKGQAN